MSYQRKYPLLLYQSVTGPENMDRKIDKVEPLNISS